MHSAYAVDTSEAVKDYRSDAVPMRRQKDKKVRYRNVNMALIGTERPNVSDKNQMFWTDRNKYKMGIVGKEERDLHAKRQPYRHWANDDLVAPVPKKSRGGRAKTRGLDRSIYDDDDDETLPGVLYSYDATSTPAFNSDAWGSLVTQAEVKWENKVFDNLVKTEYEMVSTSEEESDEEFELV